MKKTLLFPVLLLLMVGLVFPAEKYEIDTVHSSVGFSVRHMVISDVKGEFNTLSGTIMFDKGDIANSSVNVTIDAASIDTDNEKRDGHLKSPDFLAVEEHPEITFASKSIRKTDDGYVAVGDLTLRGVTKEVSIPFTVAGPITDSYGNQRIGANGELTIDRHDFGVSWSQTLDNGGLVVGNEVKISLDVEAVKPKEGGSN